MNKLKKADPDWYTDIVGGTEWEILSSDMENEEPNAAHIIALALNNKNKVALATGHLEFLRTPYDRVQAAMIKIFGSVVDD